MAINKVVLNSDVYMVCLTHALSNEKEEVMGLLIGEISETRVCRIAAAMVLRRSDKRADRVETSPEQQSAASTHAETLAATLGIPLRVVGWYHSHPHITVWPSHVDVRTQANYQMMDKGFVGLIFSVFNQDKSSKVNCVQVACFQSTFHEQSQQIEIPLQVEPVDYINSPCLESLVGLPQILTQEELESYQVTATIPDTNLVTKIHNGAVFSQLTCHRLEVLGKPLMQMLENRRKHTLRMIEELKKHENGLGQILKQKHSAAVPLMKFTEV